MPNAHRKRALTASQVRRNDGRRTLRIEQCETRLLLSADFVFGPLFPRFEPAIAEQIIVLRHEEAFRLSHHAHPHTIQIADGYIEVFSTGSFRLLGTEPQPALKADGRENGPPVTFSDEALNSLRATAESSGEWSGATDGNVQGYATVQSQGNSGQWNSNVERIIDKDLPRAEDDGLIDPTPRPDDPLHVPAPQVVDRGNIPDSLPDDSPLRPVSSRIEGASGRDEAFDLAAIYPVRAMSGNEASLSARQAQATDAAIDEGFANVLFASSGAQDASVRLAQGQAIGPSTSHARGRATHASGDSDALAPQPPEQVAKFAGDAASSRQSKDDGTTESQPPIDAVQGRVDQAQTNGEIQESEAISDSIAESRHSTVFARLDSERPRNLVLVLAAAALAEYLAKDSVRQSQSQADPAAPADLRPLRRGRRS